MNEQRRNSSRAHVPVEQQNALLRIGQTERQVCITDVSEGGFGVWSVADLGVKLNQELWLRTDAGWSKVTVTRVVAESLGFRIGLRQLVLSQKDTRQGEMDETVPFTGEAGFAEKRASYRIPVIYEQQAAILKTENGTVHASICNISAGGFKVWTDKSSIVEIGQTMLIDTVWGKFEVRVIDFVKQKHGVYLRLQRLEEPARPGENHRRRSVRLWHYHLHDLAFTALAGVFLAVLLVAGAFFWKPLPIFEELQQELAQVWLQTQAASENGSAFSREEKPSLQELVTPEVLPAPQPPAEDQALQATPDRSRPAPLSKEATSALDRGLRLFWREDYGHAIPEFKTASVHMPTNPTPQYFLALSQYRAGLQEQAQHSLTAAIQLEAKYPATDLRQLLKYVHGPHHLWMQKARYKAKVGPFRK